MEAVHPVGVQNVLYHGLDLFHPYLLERITGYFICGIQVDIRFSFVLTGTRARHSLRI